MSEYRLVSTLGECRIIVIQENHRKGRIIDTRWGRRDFLGVAMAGAAGGMGFSARQSTSAPEASRQTFTYKTVGNHSIKADVWVAPPDNKRRPVAVWIHGAALIMGDRRGIDRALRDELIKAGYVVVSIDYRLAPETCRQNGLWPKEVSGYDPDRESKAFDAFCPVRRVTPKYPPTLLIHGTADTDVPHEQSFVMDKDLARHRVPHEFISVKGGTHGLGGLERARLAEIHRQVISFLGRYLT